MSYILDALKKAEADRDPEARASLALAQHDRRRNRLLTYGLIVALIVNASLLLWLFVPESDAPVPTPARATASSPPARDVLPPPAAAPAAVPERPESPPASAEPSPAAASVRTPERQPVTEPAPAAVADPVPVSSLSRAQQQRFPRLVFSTHIYADDSDLRAVVVNGVRLEEGDRLENVRLTEITEEGAVFAFENQLVSVSVLDGWN